MSTSNDNGFEKNEKVEYDGKHYYVCCIKKVNGKWYYGLKNAPPPQGRTIHPNVSEEDLEAVS